MYLPYTHTYKCQITIHRLNFVMRRKLLRTFSSNPKLVRRGWSVSSLLELRKTERCWAEVEAEILMFSKRLGSSFLNCGTKVWKRRPTEMKSYSLFRFSMIFCWVDGKSKPWPFQTYKQILEDTQWFGNNTIILRFILNVVSTFFRLSTESHSITEGFIQRIPQEMVSVTG